MYLSTFVHITECAPGTYGINCQQLCDCKNNGLCDRQHGTCSCPAGWLGQHCETGDEIHSFTYKY